MVVFGDSFSDVGNIYDASNGTEPGIHSWQGRYSDGRVWVEFIAQYFNSPPVTTANDFAWGGATTDSNYIQGYSTFLDGPVPAVNEQIYSYLGLDLDDAATRGQSLYILWSGYNDYWWFCYDNVTANTTVSEELLKPVYTTVVDAIIGNMEVLYENGAKRFLVVNMLNMTQEPEAKTQPETVIEAYKMLVSGHNELLVQRLDDFIGNYPDSTVIPVNAFAILQCVNSQKKFLGFDNVLGACYPEMHDVTYCDDTFAYKFWDDYHPTTHTHHILAQSAIQAIYEEVVNPSEDPELNR